MFLSRASYARSSVWICRLLPSRLFTLLMVSWRRGDTQVRLTESKTFDLLTTPQLNAQSIGIKMRDGYPEAAWKQSSSVECVCVCSFYCKRTTSCTAGRCISGLLTEPYVTSGTNKAKRASQVMKCCGASWNNWLTFSHSWEFMTLWHFPCDADCIIFCIYFYSATASQHE